MKLSALRSFTFLFCSCSVIVSYCATVDTVPIYSKAMNTSLKCVVIKPREYSKPSKKKFPVVYLLHGYSGNYSNWITKVPEIKDYADDYKVLIVCPDGGYASWYFNSTLNTASQYETYIAEEVPKYIDKFYRTDTNRNAHAITGLSMGGHGALYIAWRHSQYFGAAASMSGGVDLIESAGKFEIEKLLGDHSVQSEIWKNHNVVNIAEQPPSMPLRLLIDCGTSDFFIEGNRKLHSTLLKQKIPHEYIEREGGHSWDYWKYSIHFHLLFFRKYFDTEKINKRN